MSLFHSGKDSTGVARRLCLLEQARGRGIEPLGLIGWEAGHAPAAGVAEDAVTSIVASQAPCFIEEERPRPTAPLLVRAGPGLLRRLHLCTPSEAPSLGERLSAQASDEARECRPAELAELIERYLGSPPVASSLAHGDDGPLLPWVPPWPRAALLEDVRDQQGTRPRTPPTTLVPLGLLFDPPGLPLRLIEEAVSEPTLLRGAVAGTPFRVIPSRITPLMVSLILPLRAATWRHALGSLRDEVGRRLGTAPGWFPLLPEDLVALCRRLLALHAPASAAERHAGLPASGRG